MKKNNNQQGTDTNKVIPLEKTFGPNVDDKRVDTNETEIIIVQNLHGKIMKKALIFVLFFIFFIITLFTKDLTDNYHLHNNSTNETFNISKFEN